MFKDTDYFNNINELYSMSKGINYKDYPLNRINIKKKDALKKADEYFYYLSRFNREVMSKINNYNNMIYEVDEINGGVFFKDDKISRILVPRLDNIFSSSILVHEYTHALSLDSVNEIDSMYYDEVCPFLNQFLYLEYLRDYYDTKDLIDSNMNYMIHNQLLYNVSRFKDSINEKHDDRSKIREHFKYVIGSLYSIVLYDRFKNDMDFMSNYSMLYNNKNSLEDLLKHYNVDICDKDNINLIKKLIK